ncbi:Hypothetical predicted protein [Cloeon dipterum]|uniref:Peptidoglycan recognition protein family domain-containing protein n=1 Tax=Cloeon dipterum TaxID=197152 RepID=A0A8S1C3Y8_9INSE|nr:Hypothetical predicted protein [Cloeon dipterum]
MNLLVVIVVHLLALAAALPTLPAGCPSIVSRDEWGARSSRQITRRNPLSPFLMVHHGGIRSYCTTKEACSRIIRSYQDLHMDDRGWDDIGYSFLIGEDGNIYEGRGWDRIGAHAIKYNTNSIGVCFVGDFTDRLPKDVALQAFYKLVSCSTADHSRRCITTENKLISFLFQVVPCFCGACWGPLVKIPPRPGHALEEAVSLWLEVGNLAPLEHAVLNGYGQLLEGRTSRLPKVNVFLKKVPRYQGRIARVHEAAATGDLTTLAMILEKPELATSRDDAGSTPVQKAMLANHIAIVRYLLHKSPRCLSATDRVSSR